MFFESYCDCLVFVDPSARVYEDSMLVFRKNYELLDYDDGPLTTQQIVDLCRSKTETDLKS